jgi:transposase-like protein
LTTPEPTAKRAPSEAGSERARISCPGCGRHDWVTWPDGQDTYAWKCFNCEKQFTLQRGGKH